jgi:hypothetical protein
MFRAGQIAGQKTTGRCHRDLLRHAEKVRQQVVKRLQIKAYSQWLADAREKDWMRKGVY